MKTTSKIDRVFQDVFGRTPLAQRLDDILKQALALHRFTDSQNLREKLGDLLTSSLQACTENGLDPDELVEETLRKIRRREGQYRSLGRKTRVAILGGAFSPPTVGHIALAKFVLNASGTFDEVWLMPCYGHMYGKSLPAPSHRLEMCRLAAAADGRIKVFDFEIRHKLRGETYQTVKLLQKERLDEQYDFSVVIGLDNANSFDRWVNYRDLERSMSFVVVPRKGVAPDPKVTWYLNPPHILMQPDNEIPEISSTQIREWLAGWWVRKEHQDKLEANLNPKVFQYIRAHRLFHPKD